MFARDQISLGVKVEAVAAWFRTVFPEPRVSAGFKKNAHAVAFFPLHYLVAWHVGEDQVIASARLRFGFWNPHRSFAPVETGGEHFDFCIGRQQGVGTGVQSYNFPDRRARSQVVGIRWREPDKAEADGAEGAEIHGSMCFHGVAVWLRVMGVRTLRSERR